MTDDDKIRARRLLLAAGLVVLLAAVVWVRPALAAPLPAGFSEQDIATGFERPTAVAWAPDGSMYVAEQRGRVKVVAPGATTAALVVDINTEVNSLGDRGLMSIALDKDFATNRWLYLLYVKEMQPAKPDATVDAVSVLTRVTVTPGDTSPPETVILGKQSTLPCGPGADCLPSDFHWHAVGTVRTDPADGTLWVSVGDSKDPKDTSDAKMRRPQDPNSYLGKLLHVNRDGTGMAGAPFCPGVTDLTQVCTKVYARGFRNPFRFHLRPGGKGPVVGDVGDNTREEVDLVTRGGSYGWPCHEGSIRHPSYQILPYCQAMYAAGGQTGPLWDYQHLGQVGDSITVGPVLTADAYPAEYHGDIFIADYGQGWIKRLEIDAQDRLVGVGPKEFVSPWCCAVDLALTPRGELATVGIGINRGEGPAKIRRFAFDASGNRAPVARMTATPASGVPPLAVTFDAGGSSDPDGDELLHEWDFGDGTPKATGPRVTHQYEKRGAHTARLLVRDRAGGSPSIATQTITVGRPPTATILSPADGAAFRAGREVPLRGTGSDPDGARLMYSWEVLLIHIGHAHPVLKTDPSFSPDFAFTPWADHDADSTYEVRLTVHDIAEGLTTTALSTLRPDTRRLTLRSTPEGAPVQYFPRAAAPAPLGVDALVGYRATIAAAPSFTRGGQTFRFAGWSDGGARQHDVAVPAVDTTLTATYCPTAPGAPERCAPPALPPGGRPGAPGGGERPATGAGAADAVRPVVRGLRVASRRVTRTAPATLRFSLSERARVRVTVARAVGGRRAGGRCVLERRTGRPCIRHVAVRGAVERSLAAGRATLRLPRRIGGRMLRPGRHRVTLVATDAAGNRSRAVRRTFTVRR